MATREKKPRSVNSDSPTPSLGGGSDSAPSTPTSKGKGSRASLSRQKSKQLLLNTNEDSVQSTDDIVVDPPAATESANTSAGSSSNKSTSASRTTRATTGEPSETSSGSKDKEKEKDKDDAKDSKTVTRKTVTKKKKPIATGSASSSDKTKTSVTAIKKTALLKRKTRPIVGKPVLGKKVIARKQVNAKGKKEVTVTLKDDDKKNTSLRNGKPRATDSPVSKRRALTPKDKSPKDTTTDSVTIKQERRRSDSVSKSSDVTDISTTLDTSSVKDEDDKKDDTSLSEIKRELLEENDTKSKILDKMAEAFNERKTPTVLPSKDEKTVRRSTRQRKSTPKEKEEFVAPSKIKTPVDIKSEPMDTDESESAAPLTIDTTEAPSKETPNSELEKDSSLSPELISEGVSEISVKEFYSEPAFLENNLGIEKDPKLGEIVQVQEKIKLDKGSESDVAGSAAASNGSTSVKEEIQQVVVKEEKIEEEDSKDGDEKMENEKLNSEPPMEVEKLKEIIGIVEASKVQSTAAPPVVVIPKEEILGNESPLSDRSNDKDTLMSIINKVEISLKKNDSRSDSDGERSGKASAPKAKAAAKEPKTKARNVKDKCKEDEKAKEEKLRQEKLRVEEKVREEKLRAERLKQEEEKKIMEEKIKLEQESMKTAAPEATAAPGKATSPKTLDEVVSVLEKVLPTTTVTTLSLTSADSHLVLSVTSSESTELVESPKPEPPKLEPIVSNTISLENLPAITLLKKDPNPVKSESKLENVPVKAELEILPLKEAVVAKEEKTQDIGSEPQPLQIISRSENAAAVVTLTTVTAEGNKSPLSIIKIQTDKDSDKSTIFEEIPIEAQTAKATEAVKNCDQEIKVPPPNNTPQTVVQDPPSVTEAFSKFADSSAVGSSLVHPVMFDEATDDVAKQKESHLKHLGLLTLQAASEEKQRRKELVLHKPTAHISSGASNCSTSSSGSFKSSGSGSGGVGGATKSTRNSESTGTLKTVIKLNRGEKRRARLPLKMTLQKGKGKGAEKDANGGDGNGETAFYIIQNETDHQQSQSMTDSAGLAATAALGRKAHSRSHTTDVVTLPEVVAESAVKEVVQKALVIPEKASSFNVHPERLCQDQCFYCGGKFGLYDTPCHIAAMKSSERQQNILASEVKIKIDSCLCDACFRHVDRKANCPSYRKKTEAKSLSSLAKIQSNVDATHEDKQSQDECSAGTSASSSENLQTSAEESKEGSVQRVDELVIVEEKIQGSCHVRNCGAGASHTIRRKWLLKMKKTISKILEINLEQTNAVSNLIPLCDGHYELISHLMICAMCKRRLPKNHIYYIVNEIPQLERLIQEQGIAMKLGNSTLVVCKLCRYYANLLLKPPDAKSQKAQFIKNYNRRLLQFYERENELREMALASVEPTRIVSNPDIVISDGEDDTIEIVPVGESASLQRRRRSHHSRKSTDLSIVETNCAQMGGDLEEVTITPAPKLTSTATANVSGNSSIILDTDVSIEQPASVEKRRKDDSIDMTKALKANPNISMRELFPGEEELGIHINIPYNNTSTRTPEGWTKVVTTLQYDDSTRTLWEELQKPYGNQSSFLRHLVLLEKYFRNGDLILSPQAKNNAVTYSEAVQNRLRSFDNVPTPPPVAVIDKTAIRQQLGNAPITITAATTKTRTKSSTEPVSLLKSNNPHLVGGSSSSDGSLKRKLSTDAKAKSASGKAEVAAGSKVIKLDETIVVPGGKASSLVPPELISINAKQNVTITSIPAGKPPPTVTQSQPNPQQQSLLQPQQSLLQPLQPQSQNKKSPGSAGMREIIKLPDQLTEAERRETSKPWRPTLIPITPGSSETIKAGPLYQTADGRRLPKLVQVMSGGKPYHISIHDYNRMCILRREKLLQQRQDMMQHQLNQHQRRLQQQSPPNPASMNATKTTGSKSLLDSAKMVQIPNQILEQNSLIPIPNNSGNNGGSNSSSNASNKTNGPSNELQQLIKMRKPGSTNNMIPPVTSGPAFFKNTLPMNANPNKPISLPNTTSMFSMAGTNQHQHHHQQQQQQQHQSGSTNTSPPVGSLPTTPSQLDQLIKSNNQFLNNFVSQSQLSAMVAAAAAAAVANSASANSLLGGGGGGAGGGTSGGSIVMDNSAAHLLSKIPKSLTVIPQQKQRSLSRVSSNEDQSSA